MELYGGQWPLIQVLPFLTGPGVEGAVEKEVKGGLTGAGGRAEAGTEWLLVTLEGAEEVFMMSATIFWRDRPWGTAAVGGLATVFRGIL